LDISIKTKQGSLFSEVAAIVIEFLMQKKYGTCYPGLPVVPSHPQEGLQP
jgi:hypothetical protein